MRTLGQSQGLTKGMGSVAGEDRTWHGDRAQRVMFGQELNPESGAICKADRPIKGQDEAMTIFGNTLPDDSHPAQNFVYMLKRPARQMQTTWT